MVNLKSPSLYMQIGQTKPQIKIKNVQCSFFFLQYKTRFLQINTNCVRDVVQVTNKPWLWATVSGCRSSIIIIVPGPIVPRRRRWSVSSTWLWDIITTCVISWWSTSTRSHATVKQNKAEHAITRTVNYFNWWNITS